jgi:hypothetical protein
LGEFSKERTLPVPKQKWFCNMYKDLTGAIPKHVYCTDSGWSEMPESCEHGEEPAHFPKSGDFLDHLSDDLFPIEGKSFHL